MKKIYTIIVETKLHNVYKDEEQNINITDQIENELHNAIKHIIIESLDEENLNELILNDIINDYSFDGWVENYSELSDYGNIQILLRDENSKEENICNIKSIEDIEK